MYIEHNGVTWLIERLNLAVMQARACAIGVNFSCKVILVFNEAAEVVEVIR